MDEIQQGIIEDLREQIRKEEQQKLGRDLHDNLASLIACINHNIEQLRLYKNEETQTLIETLSKQIKEVYIITREKSHKLMATENYLSTNAFKNKIKTLFENVFPNHLYKTTIAIDENCIQHLSWERKVHLLSIIREFIANVINHSRADTIDLLIYQEDQQLLLRFRDNGVGINAKKQLNEQANKTYGLNNINARIQSIGGSFTYNAIQPKGTEACIFLPLLPYNQNPA